MKTKKSILVILMAFIACIASAQVSLTVNVPAAGGFSAAFTAAGGDKATLTDLTVTGNIDARDVKFMRDNLPKLALLNLEAVTIAAYNGSGGTSKNTSSYPANKMPDRSFDLNNGNANNMLKTIVFPVNLKVIGVGAFIYCEGLTSLKIPETVTTIEDYAFNGCRNVTGDFHFPVALVTIGRSAFGACGFTGKLLLPAKNISIDDMAFQGCGFSGSLIIPDNYTKHTPMAFAACKKLTSLFLSNNLKTIEYDLFAGCIGFVGEIIIPGSVTSVNCGFRWCTGFTSCYIPGSVKTLQSAFWGCTELKKVVIDNAQPLSITIDADVFKDVNKYSCELIVPKGSKAAYQAIAVWNQFNTITEALFVTLNTQGGHPAAPVTTTLTNATIAEPGNPIREGYSFAGWYKEATCTNAWNFASDLVSAPTTLYAKWVANPENTFTVSFVVDGGTGVANVVAPANTAIAQPVAPTKADCTFGGWYKEADFKDAWNFTSDTVTSQTMLFAKWNVNTVTVSFNVDGGTAIANREAPVKMTITKPGNPSKTGYTFGGWYKEPEFTTAWNFTTDLVTAPVTLYAKWNFKTGIEKQQLSGIKIYPNPVSTLLNLSNLPTKAEIKILSTDGKLIKEVEATSNETTIDVSCLPKGIYLLRMKSKEESKVQKFVKQ